MSFGDRFDLGGRVLLVNNASTEIGRAVALRAASLGASLLLLALSGSADELAASVLAIRPGSHVRIVQPSELAALSSESTIDLLVNAPATTGIQRLTDLDPGEWQAISNDTIGAAFSACRALVPGMVERKCGAIVNIAPRLGEEQARATASGMRAQMIGLTKALARELAPSGVRVNAVAIGHSRKTSADEGAEAAAIANAVVFLLSDAAAYITGETLNVG